MTPLKFDTFSSPGSFQQIERPDLTGLLNQSTNNLIQSQQVQGKTALSDIERQRAAELQTLEQQAFTYESLSQLSKTAGNYAIQKNKEREEAVFAEYYAKAMNGEITLDDPTYFAEVAAENETQNVVNKIAAQAADNGADPSSVIQLKGLTGIKRRAAEAGILSAKANEWLFQLEDRLGEVAQLAPEEQKIALQQLQKQFIIENNLQGFRGGAFTKYFTTAIQEGQQKLLGRARTQYAVEESYQQLEGYKQQLAETGDLLGFIDATRSLRNERGYYGRSGAWKEAMAYLTELDKSGNLPDQLLNTIKGQVDPTTNRTVGERWKVQFDQFEKDRAARIRSDYKEQEDENRILFDQAEQQLEDYFNKNGASEYEVLQSAKQLEKQYGIRSERLERYASTFSYDAEQRDRLDKQFEKLAEQGLLRSEMVSRAPLALQDKYMKRAKQQEQATDQSSDFKLQLKAIENQVKTDSRVKVSPESGVVTLIIGELQAKFRRKVAEYVATGRMNAQQAASQAVSEVFTEFSTSPRYAMNNQGEFANFMPKNTAATSKLLNNKLNNIRVKLRYGGKASLDKTPGLMFDKAELLQIEQGYGEPGWSVPPVAAYWASQLNMNPLDIINRQRTAAGLKPLATPQSIERVQQTISPALQALLNRFPSPNRSIRALGSTGAFDPVIVPKGYGPVVQKAARANGIDPSILAGLLETENGWKETGTSSAGAKGIAQIVPEYHPGVNVNDPIASINYAAKYLSQLQRRFGGDMKLAIIAYNAGPGNVEKYRGPIPGDRESGSYYGKVLKAAAKYGYGASWKDTATMRGKFRVIEYLTGDTAHGGYRADHGGDNYHEHIAFATKAERDAAIRKLQANGIQVGSVDRPGDPGNHGRGLAIDVPASQVPVGKEKELSRRVRSILGLS